MEVEEEEDDAPLARMDDDQHAVGPEDLQMDAPGEEEGRGSAEKKREKKKVRWEKREQREERDKSTENRHSSEKKRVSSVKVGYIAGAMRLKCMEVEARGRFAEEERREKER
eukprot:3729781-Rhodomonas_salina.1